jgi:preprotein translocase subunit YajC
MGLILGIGIASAIGTLLGNLGVFWFIGVMAQRQQKKQEKELLKLQNEFLEMRRKENERMQRYAKMEG